MNWCGQEPTLKEMLSDSIVRAVMDADGIDPHELEVMLKEVGRTMSQPREVTHDYTGQVSSRKAESQNIHSI